MSHFLITGGTGLIGTALCQHLHQLQHQITVLSRQHAEQVKQRCGEVEVVNNLDQIAPNVHFDVVINLAGAPIADRLWSTARKKVLEQSRIDLTLNLVQWLIKRKTKPDCLISGSAIGWYGDQADNVITEQSSFHDEYTHQLCEQWEQQTLIAQEQGIRVCIIRTGLVLSDQGGILKRMLLPFKLGLGGKFGNGQHYMSWIHIEDMVRLIVFLAQTDTAEAIYNATAPIPVTNKQFTQSLSKVLHRPALLTTPSGVLKAMLGEMSALFITGQRVIPEKAQAEGFNFDYTDLDSALSNLLSHSN
jgi:hypothetical protein